MRHGLNAEAIPHEHHLVLAVQRVRVNLAISRQVADLATEAGEPLPTATRATAGGDREKLRGIPCTGRVGGGAIRGSLPHVHGLKDRTTSELANLSRDIEGTSPGTDPLAALLAKEAMEAEQETARLLGAKAALGVDAVR